MKYLKKISLALTSIIFLLIVLIIIDKLIGYKQKLIDQNTGAYYFPSKTKEVYRSGEFTFTAEINSLGFRGHEYFAPKSTNSIRIMTIGDSFTYGWGVSLNDSWPQILEKELPAKIGKKVEVLNFSSPGHGPINYKNIVSDFLKIYLPDYILIGLLEGDDLSQLYPPPTKTVGQSPETKKRIEQYLQKIGRKPPIFNQIPILFPNISLLIKPKGNNEVADAWKSSIFNIVNSFTDEELKKFESLNIDIQDKFLTNYIQPSIITSTVGTPDFNTRITKLNDERTKDAISRLKSIMKEITFIASNTNVKTVIVDTPYDIFVSKKYAEAQAAMGLEYLDKSWESNVPDLINKEVASASGAMLISNIDVIRARCQDNCYFYYDSHLNKNGHRIMADNIVSEMAKIINGDRKN